MQNDEAVAGGDAEIENDEVGLLLAGGTDGGQSVAGGDNMSGSWPARTGFFGPGLVPPRPGRVSCGMDSIVCA